MRAGRAYRRCGVGELVEAVPDRHDVDAPRGVQRLDRAVVHLEAERAREGVGLRIHVDAGELPAGSARRAEKGADVAPDLDAGAAPAEDLREARRLRVVRRALRVVERA